MMNEEEIKVALEDAWHRWLASCGYAEEHKTLRFFKKFCKYVVGIWNKAEADAYLLQQFLLGQLVSLLLSLLQKMCACNTG